MADLQFEIALSLAGSLVTIGHPYAPAAVNATAMDLVRLCKGAILDGRPWPAEQQAQALIEEIRTTWEDGWPEKGGTKKLVELFRKKYAPKGPEWAPASAEQLVARGLIRPPCGDCDGRLYVGERPNIRYCTRCAEGRHLASYAGDKALERMNAEPAPRIETRAFQRPTLLTPEQMIGALNDEQIQKRKQLANLENGK